MLRGLAAALVFFLAACLTAPAQERGAHPLDPEGLAEALALERNSYALVIGINAYSGGWPRLSNATVDAAAVAGELERHGFQVTLATDLDSDALEEAIEDFVYERGREPDARLLIWYAGHGHTIDGEAYLVPADAPPADTDWEFRRKALSMRDFGKFMREARSRHVLAVFDSCFSGGVFETVRAAEPPAITRATGLPVRQMISSGEADQTVSDDGTFRRLFIDALRGDEPLADANRDGYITGSELGLFLSDKVTSLTQNRQTPRYGKLRELGLDRGDFVFRVDAQAVGGQVEQRHAALPPESPAPPSRDTGVRVPSPVAPVAPAATRETLTLGGGETAILQEGRLVLSMTGTPTGGRSDLVALMVNGRKAVLAAGRFVAVETEDGGCVLTLMQIFTGQNRAEFLMQCGPPDAMRRDATPAASVALSPRPGVMEEFTMAGGSSRLIEPGSIVMTFLRTPTGGRRDLAGITLNGNRQSMAVGQQQEFATGGAACTLTMTKIHYGENRADFLWRCG